MRVWGVFQKGLGGSLSLSRKRMSPLLDPVGAVKGVGPRLRPGLSASGGLGASASDLIATAPAGLGHGPALGTPSRLGDSMGSSGRPSTGTMDASPKRLFNSVPDGASELSRLGASFKGRPAAVGARVPTCCMCLCPHIHVCWHCHVCPRGVCACVPISMCVGMCGFVCVLAMCPHVGYMCVGIVMCPCGLCCSCYALAVGWSALSFEARAVPSCGPGPLAWAPPCPCCTCSTREPRQVPCAVQIVTLQGVSGCPPLLL